MRDTDVSWVFICPLVSFFPHEMLLADLFSIKTLWLSGSMPFYMIVLVVACTSPRRIHLPRFILLHVS